MVLTLEEIGERFADIAKKYKIPALYVFGSYARGEATEESDIDIVYDRTGSTIRGLFDLGGFYLDLMDAVGKSVDIVSLQQLNPAHMPDINEEFAKTVKREMRQIYG